MLKVRSVSYRYAVNGNVSGIIKTRRGLRQGDPLSPFLFVLVMEYLHRMLNTLKAQPNFNFHPRCDKLEIINFCFADDLVMFTRGNLVCPTLNEYISTIFRCYRVEGK